MSRPRHIMIFQHRSSQKIFIIWVMKENSDESFCKESDKQTKPKELLGFLCSLHLKTVQLTMFWCDLRAYRTRLASVTQMAMRRVFQRETFFTNAKKWSYFLPILTLDSTSSSSGHVFVSKKELETWIRKNIYRGGISGNMKHEQITPWCNVYKNARVLAQTRGPFVQKNKLLHFHMQ